jgi:hypothetical protein
MNDRELIHAALQWHAAHARRLTAGAEKRRLDRTIKAEGFDAMFSAARSRQIVVARELTELKRRELAALRALSKACAKQRGNLDASDVIDLNGAITLLPADE